VLHRALIGLAWFVRAGLIRSLSPLAPLMHWATNHLRWGEHRGGMFVEVEGIDRAGRPARRSWHLLAEGRDGPLIPSMAVEALVRKALAGEMPVMTGSPHCRPRYGDRQAHVPLPARPEKQLPSPLHAAPPGLQATHAAP